jgi:hypothetical protein
MPYICLANANVPNGVLQITDLWPNVSLDSTPDTPPAQTRYLRRPVRHTPIVDDVSGLVVGVPAERNKLFFEGVGAYLLDHVDPGANYVARATVTLTGVAALDVIIIKGIYFRFAAGANDLVGKAGSVGNPFLVGLGANDAAAATNLIAALNDNGDVAPALNAVATLNVHTNGTAGGAANIVVIQPETTALVKGPTGQLTITTSNGTRLALDTASLALGRLTRTVERWDSVSLPAAIDAIQNRVDGGLSLTLAAIDTALGTAVGSDLSGATVTGSNSNGTLTELLQILAGRTYRIPAGAAKFTAATAPDKVSVWSATQRGSFTVASTVFGGQMSDGVWAPSAPWVKNGGLPGGNRPTFTGGDVINNDVGPARRTDDSSALQASIQNGQLAHYSSGVTLFPSAAVQAHVAPTLASKQIRQAALLNQRLVAVYDDDGSLLV